MMRLTRVYWHYFSWLGTLLWTTVIGLVLVAAGYAFPKSRPAHAALITLGLVFALIFVTLLGSVTYRQLVSNRRLLLVPGFRTQAALGLLLVALTCTAAGSLLAATVTADIGRDALIRVALLQFAAISGYLLITQWLIIYRFGVISVFLLPILAAGIGQLGDELLAFAFGSCLLVAGAAGLGWIWLLASTHGPTPPRPMAGPAIDSRQMLQSSSSAPELKWLPQDYRNASPAGTLMRGMSDGWRFRILADLLQLLIFPVAMWLLVRLMMLLNSVPMAHRPEPAFFLLWGVWGVNLQASMLFGEWPVNLRRVWVRMGKDRDDLWRCMERSLLGDVLLFGLGASLVAAVLWAFADTGPRVLLLYVTGVVVSLPTTMYFCFLFRTNGWSRIVQMLIITLLALGLLFATATSLAGERPNRIFWLLAALALMALGLRALARHRFLRIDWCAVRPTRLTRRTHPS